MKRNIVSVLVFTLIAALAFQVSGASAAAPAISDAEAEALQFMREEEKLAHDLYAAFAELYDLPLFGNIANAETQHGEAIAGLLTLYGLDDPAAGMAAGEFANADLQALYDDLLAQGSPSLLAALQAGARVEETDILDLQAALNEVTDPEIQRVFGHLLAGSVQHLQAFAMVIERETGAAYVPELLGAAAYAELLASAGQNGYGAGGQGYAYSNGDGSGVAGDCPYAGEGCPLNPQGGAGPNGNRPGNGRGPGRQP